MRESRWCTRALVRETQVGFLMGCGASSNWPADDPCVPQPFFNFLIRKSELIGKHEYPMLSPRIPVLCRILHRYGRSWTYPCKQSCGHRLMDTASAKLQLIMGLWHPRRKPYMHPYKKLKGRRLQLPPWSEAAAAPHRRSDDNNDRTWRR